MPLKIRYSSQFLKKIEKLQRKKPKTATVFKNKMALFNNNPRDSSLKTHKLSGNMKNQYAFFVENDCRVIFSWEGEEVEFILIGKHDEVY
jgi:addiction module RelE/StbE family toxin